MSKKLSKEEHRVLREKGTEAPFSGKYNVHKEKGTYKCKYCGAELFSSDAKFNSTTGWPAFDKAKNVKLIPGTGFAEVTCAKCDSHLGHVFDDGPTKTGKHYCINSVCLDFKKADKKNKDKKS